MFQIKVRKYRKLNDNELIDIFKESKSQVVFSVIYERYGHLVMGVCLKYLKDEAESQDLSSKIFEELADKIFKHSITHFKSWLYQLVKNECLMFHRKNKYFYVSSDLLQEEQVEEHESKEEKLDLLEKAVLTLSHEQGNCIKLFYLEDKSYQEISTLLNIELKKVKSFIQNGKRNLQNILLQNEVFTK
ncbi:MAG: sigma-70 family RNA polymerase sigma factor [Bacteroidota bacterium]